VKIDGPMPKLDIQRSATGVPERISMGAGNLSREHLHLSTLYPVAGNKSGFASRLYETFQGARADGDGLTCWNFWKRFKQP